MLQVFRGCLQVRGYLWDVRPDERRANRRSLTRHICHDVSQVDLLLREHRQEN